MPKMGNSMAHGGLPYIDTGDGEKRILACLKPIKKYSHHPEFKSAFPVIPQSEWKEFDEDPKTRILDQDGHGSCVGHGSDTGFELAWRRHGGTPQVFSANYIYSLINGGSDNGAVVGDAADALQKNGVCLDSTVPESNNWIYTRQMPSQANQEAARFKAGTIYRVQSWEEIVSAVINRLPVVIGLEIGSAFDPDAEGFLPHQRGGGGGHCLCILYGLRNKGGVWYVKMQNSWGTRWGKGGMCWIESSYFQGGFGDHFVYSGPLEDPQDPGNLPTTPG